MPRELLEDLRAAISPVAFAKRCGLTEPDPWQREFLSSEARRVICCAGRQTGKSACSAILALHRALHYPSSTVVVVSPSLRQSQLTFKKVADAYRALGKPVDAEVENRLSLELANGSVVVSLPGSEKTIRGHSAVNLLILDEAAAIPNELWAAVQPMTLVSRGRVILVSTPRGKRGKFWELWRDREARGWAWWHVPVTSVGRIPPEAVADQRRDMTEQEFRQELLCEFVEASGSYFGFERVMAALTDEVRLLVIEGVPETGG